MAFRTSRLYKALDKHEATTPQQIKDLVAAGDDADRVDGSSGKNSEEDLYTCRGCADFSQVFLSHQVMAA